MKFPKFLTAPIFEEHLRTAAAKKALIKVATLYGQLFMAALQSWTKGCGQFTKLSKKDFTMECFTADFLNFLLRNVKIC